MELNGNKLEGGVSFFSSSNDYLDCIDWREDYFISFRSSLTTSSVFWGSLTSSYFSSSLSIWIEAEEVYSGIGVTFYSSSLGVTDKCDYTLLSDCG